MTQEEINNLQIGDVYKVFQELRTITAISPLAVYYSVKDRPYSPCYWNNKKDLLDCEYQLIKKSNMDTFKIEPGMVLITAEKLENARNEDTYVAFLDSNDKISAINFAGNGWVHIEKSNMSTGCQRIYYVLNRPSNNIRDGKVLWKREDSIKEMTVAEIEQKLGIAAGSLRIKK